MGIGYYELGITTTKLPRLGIGILFIFIQVSKTVALEDESSISISTTFVVFKSSFIVIPIHSIIQSYNRAQIRSQIQLLVIFSLGENRNFY